MNKLFKVMYVNILKLFGLNEIVTLRKKNIKSNLEIKAIVLSIVLLAGCYILYKAYYLFNVKNVLLVGFVISTLMCFLLNFNNINSILFYDVDTEYLFSLPISTKQIVLSKLFNIYLKNIVYVIAVMLTSFLFYINNVNVSDTLGIMLIISTLMIPLVPIILITLILYLYNYIKINNIILLRILNVIIVVGISLLCLNVNSSKIFNISYYAYPLIALFDLIKECDIIAFLFYIMISILVIYLYTLILTDKYQVMVSTLKGVNKSKKKSKIRCINFRKFGGSIKKELLYLFNNYKYFNNVFSVSIIFSLLLIILVIFKVRINQYDTMTNLYGPPLLAMVGSLGVFTINGISIEQNNLEIVKAMPMGFSKYLLSKVVSNLLVGLLFIIVNGICYSIIFNRHGFNMVIGFILPVGALLFNVIVCLLIDLKFPIKRANNDSEILNRRLLSIVPKVISIIIGLLPLLLPMISDTKIILLTYLAIFLLGTIICLIYYLVKHCSILNNLFN